MKRVICLLLCLNVIFLLAVGVAAAGGMIYPDVSETAQYAKAVLELADMEIMKGDDLGKFNPDQTITRQEFAAVVCRLAGEETSAAAIKVSNFDDVPDGHWAVGYISKAAELGIVNGYGDGKFGPTDPVTVEQAAKMLVCAWGYGDMAEEAGGWPEGYMSVASDMNLLNSVTESGTMPAKRSSIAMMAYQVLLYPVADEQGGTVG